MGSSLPCVERNETDLPPQTKALRPSFKYRSHFAESPAYVTLGQYRVVRLSSSSLDAFFQSSVRDQLLYRYKAEVLSQWPDEEAALLVCGQGEDSGRYTVLTFNCLGEAEELRRSIEHTLTRYQFVQKLDLVGCGGAGTGLYFLFRNCSHPRAAPKVQELPLSTTALQLEAQLNALSAQRLSFRLALSTPSTLYLVLGQEPEHGSYIVLDLGRDSLLERVASELEKNAKNERMTLVGLVATPSSAMLVYLYQS